MKLLSSTLNIKHVNALDVFFTVDRVEIRKEVLKITGSWCNLGYSRSWILELDTITIKNVDLRKWLFNNDPTDGRCLRNATWY